MATSVTLTGTFKTPGGVNRTGFVHLWPRHSMFDPAGQVIAAAGGETVIAISSGTISQTVYATDDPTTKPASLSYDVWVEFTDDLGDDLRFHTTVPHDAVTWDLSNATPPQHRAYHQYATVADLAAISRPVAPLDVLPANANVMNDEFGGSTLDDKWETWYSQGDETLTVDNGRLTYAAPAKTSVKINAVTQPIPSGACSFATKLAFAPVGPQGTGSAHGGLIVPRSTSSSGGYLFVVSRVLGSTEYGGGLQTFDQANAATISSYADQLNPPANYMRVDVSSDHQSLTFYRSQDGENWALYRGVSESYTFANIGFAVQTYNLGGFGPSILNVEWFRRLS